MASPEVAVPFLRGPAVKFNSSGRLKVWNSQTSVASPNPLPQSYSWPAASPLPVTADTGFMTAELRDDNSAMSLPVIDLAGLRSGDAAAREQIVRELGVATEAWGFFQVVNHSVADELQGRMHEQARKFFNLPLDVKKKADIIGPNPRTFGYRGTLKSAYAGAKEVVLKESLADSRESSCSVDDLAAKIWPGGNSTFSNTVQEHCLSVEALGHQLLELLAESLGVQRDFFSRHFKNPDERSGTWRLHHFPPNSLPYDVWRTVPHSDPSVLTLLKQDVGGLQVKKPGGRIWVDVKALPGSFVVNVGDILEAWSNGRFPSVEHRVALNKECERFSMVHFLDAKPSLRIEAPPELIDEDHPSLFVPFIARDFRAIFDRSKQAGNIRKGSALDCVRRHVA
ncbi:unnamed protein product [Calypogeia fissa]